MFQDIFITYLALPPFTRINYTNTSHNRGNLVVTVAKFGKKLALVLVSGMGYSKAYT